jgi:hypothetical protein
MKKNKIYFLVICMLLCLRSYSQNIDTNKYTSPEFVGGKKAYTEYLNKYLRYPPEEYLKGRMGIVTAIISIDSSGNITNVATEGENKILSEEVKRVFLLMPKWSSGKFNGNGIDTSISKRIYFSIERSRTKDDSTAVEILISKRHATFFTTDEIHEMKEYAAAKSLYDKGVVELQNKNASGALDLFNQAEQQGFREIDLYYNRGVAYLKVANKEAACQDWLEGARRGDTEALDLYTKKCK